MRYDSTTLCKVRYDSTTLPWLSDCKVRYLYWELIFALSDTMHLFLRSLMEMLCRNCISRVLPKPPDCRHVPFNNDDNKCISRAPFNVKHAQLRWTGSNKKIQNTCIKTLKTAGVQTIMLHPAKQSYPPQKKKTTTTTTKQKEKQKQKTNKTKQNQNQKQQQQQQQQQTNTNKHKH